MVRASLEHSFLPGASVWSVSGRHVEVTDSCAHDALGDPYPSVACERLLADSERAAMQWKLEAQLAAFEEAVLRGPDVAAEDDLAQDPASPPASPLGQAY